MAGLKLDPVREGAIIDELNQHLEDHYRELLSAGSSIEEARKGALAELSETDVLALRLKTVLPQSPVEPLVLGTSRRESLITDLWQDLRFGVRMLVKSPGVTLIAILTLTLGIGANTAIFSLIDAVLLRPLPFQDAERLVMVWEDAPKIGYTSIPLAPADYVDIKAQNKSFEDVATFTLEPYNVTGGGEPERIVAQQITANLFPLLGTQPMLGRNFLPEEDRPGGGKAVILSYGFWRRRFGGDSNVVGKDLLLDDQRYTVIGVMPQGFQLLSKETSLWTPKAFTSKELANRDESYLTLIARLKPGISVGQARSDIGALVERISQDSHRRNIGLTSSVIPLRQQVAGEIRLPLIVLLVAVGFVLLIACANIANLLLSRGAARYKEIAVRTALGAHWGRIVRQLLTESILLAVIGGAAGLACALASFTFLRQIIPDSLSLGTGLKLNLTVLVFTMLVSVVTGAVFGLAPALQGTRVDLNEALKQNSGRSGSNTGHNRLRAALVVAEVALALVLLVGAGLLIKTFIHLRGLEMGFRPDNLLTLRTELSRQKYSGLPKRAAFYQEVLSRVRVIPGVVSAGYVTAVPMVQKWGSSSFSVEGKEAVSGQDALSRQVSPGYMETVGMTLRRGRYFDEHDGTQSERVAVINETMARRFWGEKEPMGSRFKIGGADSSRPWMRVVGVVADIKEMGLEVSPKATMFFPYTQMAESFWNTPREMAIRVAGNEMSVSSAVRQAIWSVDGDQPVSNIRSMNEILGEEVAQRRVIMMLLGTFAAIALLMAAIGIYGVLSYAVSQRTQEIGVRMALGAQPRDMLRLIVSRGLALVGLGVVVGLVASFALTRLMKGLLVGVSPTDPLTFGVIALLLIGVAMVACYVPARRATRIDPLIALRCE
jgi:putative ABC transport system permease protein